MFRTRARSGQRSENKERNIFSVLFTAVILLSALTSCATAPPIATFDDPSSNFPITLKDDILVLPPVLTYENLQNEQRLSAAEFGGPAIEKILFNSAKSVVISRNLSVVELAAIKETNERETFSKIRPIIPNLSQGVIDGNASSILTDFYSRTNNQVILVNYLRVKVGTSGGWNPNSGAITSSDSKSVFYAALIQGDTGQILWRNQVLLREIPKLKNPLFSDSLKLLFTGFPKKEAKP